MNPDRRQRIDDLFDAALDQPAADRAAFLAASCGDDSELRAEVEALLVAHHRTAGPLDRSIESLAASLLDEHDVARHIGPYRVLRELGRGGMGVVYLGERDDGQFQRRVAIKVVRSGFDDGQIQRRFLAERQILASLSHPHIAQLLDGGVTDGQLPYLVMEYVEGLPLTTYCDSERLDVGSRLRLFQAVCAAVHHAHQNLIIHRDLKPSNIIVGPDGRVKLLDFGIAKLINPSLGPTEAPFTRLERWVMTPDYASPEQIRGQPLTTASDVYGLGVILYELLCGHRPYEVQTGTPDELLEIVCRRDPERPSARVSGTSSTSGVERSQRPVEEVSDARDATPERLRRQLRGDLDAIVMMALRKEPGRRYGLPQVLSDDIQRHLDGLPVTARQGSRRYHALKFLRRRRVEAGAALVVALSLVAGLAIAARQAAVAGRERDRAETALMQAGEVTDFLMSLFRSGEMDPATGAAGDITARDLLRRGVTRVDALADQPAVQARMLGVIGLMQHGVGAFDEAQDLLARAVDIQRTLPDQAALAESLIHLSWVYRSRGQREAAHGLVAEALEIRRRVLPPDDEAIADAVYELGFVAPTNQELEARYRESLAMLQRAGARPEWQVRLLQGITTSLRRQGRFAEAVAADRTALDLAVREFGRTHFRTGLAMIHLADQVRDLEQDLRAAEQLYLEGLELLRRGLGSHHLDLVHPLNALAVVQTRRGDPAGAERYHREALRIRSAAMGDHHPAVALGMGTVALDLAGQGRLAEAEQTAREALALLEQVVGPGHPDVGTAVTWLARILLRAGRADEADQLYRTAIDLKAPRSEGLRIDNAQVRREYGRVLVDQGRMAEAEEQLLRSFDLLLSVYGHDQHPNTAEGRRALMALYQRWGRPELVERYRVPPGQYFPY